MERADQTSIIAPGSPSSCSASAGLGRTATAWLPIASCAEENDFIVNHDGELRRYQKALQAPKGILTVPALVKELAAVPVPV